MQTISEIKTAAVRFETASFPGVSGGKVAYNSNDHTAKGTTESGVPKGFAEVEEVYGTN